ncbi:heme-degrading domain-containing protein [Anaerotalea alkaliphila]|uniref:Heme-degrading domain-containing protein n=1 Tax=Anaerotalea alkaliphila TaxID=2662126 RepID=A0A7X5HTL8_9FIRM|nr:heme-binding protein [Anaerotalea alkaliphila]NDL66414.1 hypothetical protein [Anaerotalea alkaliphila]
MIKEAKEKMEALAAEEQALGFDRFSRADALEVGLLVLKKAKRHPDPIAIEITINGLVVFRHFTEGSLMDSELWLARKRNSVDLMSMSSLRFKYWLESQEITVADRMLDPNAYAAGGGGFPIRLTGTGVVGSICVSGLPNHLDDHQLVVDALTEFKQKA